MLKQLDSCAQVTLMSSSLHQFFWSSSIDVRRASNQS